MQWNWSLESVGPNRRDTAASCTLLGRPRRGLRHAGGYLLCFASPPSRLSFGWHCRSVDLLSVIPRCSSRVRAFFAFVRFTAVFAVRFGRSARGPAGVARYTISNSCTSLRGDSSCIVVRGSECAPCPSSCGVSRGLTDDAKSGVGARGGGGIVSRGARRPYVSRL